MSIENQPLGRKISRRRFISSATAATMLASLRPQAPAAQAATVSPQKGGAVGVSAQAYERATRRAAALVARMTLKEKAGQLGNTAPAIKRLGLPAYQYWHEALHGLLRGGPCTSFPVPLAMANT